MAAVFGDTEDIAVYSADIHVDHTTHEVIVDEHEGTQVRRRSARDVESGGHATANGEKQSLSDHSAEKLAADSATHVDRA